MKNKALLDASLKKAVAKWAEEEEIVIEEVKISLHIHCAITAPRDFKGRAGITKKAVNVVSTQTISDADWNIIFNLPLNGDHRYILERMKSSGDLTIRNGDIVDRYEDIAAAAASLTNMFRNQKTKYRIHYPHGKWIKGPFKLVIIESRRGH